ncbi:unnamed protein product [Leuciscus chuanchicus]
MTRGSVRRDGFHGTRKEKVEFVSQPSYVYDHKAGIGKCGERTCKPHPPIPIPRSQSALPVKL